MKRLFVVMAAMALCSGCAVQKSWNCIGGSKADGTVKLAYNYHMFERPEVDNAQALDLATKKCQAWGYTAGEAFGSSTQNCINYGQSGCNAWQVTAEYQCIGGK